MGFGADGAGAGEERPNKSPMLFVAAGGLFTEEAGGEGPEEKSPQSLLKASVCIVLIGGGFEGGENAL